jgi:putative N-acetylmannosamine-6-phosphate epimerase
METHGVIQATTELGSKSRIKDVQLVNKQVDIPCVGILGRDFLQSAKAKMYYETRSDSERGEV